MKPKRELIRIVINQTGDVALDPTGKKPGRGAYVCRNRTCIEQAVQAHRLEKGLRAAVGTDVVSQLVAEMEALPDASEDNDTKTG
jgi:hypothetical protein